MPNSRMDLWQHPVAPEGVLLAALHIIRNYAYAGHGEADSFDQMATLPSLQTALEQHRDKMAKQIRTVYVLEKLLLQPFDLGRHEHNGRAREFHELPIPRLIGAVGLLIPPTVDTMLSPEQAAALNRIRLQDTALRDRTQLLELQQAGQPEQTNLTIAALTRPNPLQRTTAPYEVPASMMADAPRQHNTVERPPLYEGPPRQVVHPPPSEARMQVQPLQNVDLVAEMHATKVLHDNSAAHKPTLQD